MTLSSAISMISAFRSRPDLDREADVQRDGFERISVYDCPVRPDS